MARYNPEEGSSRARWVSTSLLPLPKGAGRNVQSGCKPCLQKIRLETRLNHVAAGFNTVLGIMLLALDLSDSQQQLLSDVAVNITR